MPPKPSRDARLSSRRVGAGIAREAVELGGDAGEHRLVDVLVRACRAGVGEAVRAAITTLAVKMPQRLGLVAVRDVERAGRLAVLDDGDDPVAMLELDLGVEGRQMAEPGHRHVVEIDRLDIDRLKLLIAGDEHLARFGVEAVGGGAAAAGRAQLERITRMNGARLQRLWCKCFRPRDGMKRPMMRCNVADAATRAIAGPQASHTIVEAGPGSGGPQGPPAEKLSRVAGGASPAWPGGGSPPGGGRASAAWPGGRAWPGGAPARGPASGPERPRPRPG